MYTKGQFLIQLRLLFHSPPGLEKALAPLPGRSKDNSPIFDAKTLAPSAFAGSTLVQYVCRNSPDALSNPELANCIDKEYDSLVVQAAEWKRDRGDIEREHTVKPEDTVAGLALRYVSYNSW